MKKKVVIINTSFVSVNDLKDLFKEMMPDVTLYNMVDESLLPEVLSNGGLTNRVTRRICAYALEAEGIGADLILNQCSSVGEAVDVARKMINIPYLKIDEPMAEEAVKIGGKVSVIATVASTLAPSIRLIENTARRFQANININSCLVEGAFDILYYRGDKEMHNRMVVEKIRQEANRCDSIVLAQGSMICLLPQVADIQTPILTSPRSGIKRVKEILENMKERN